MTFEITDTTEFLWNTPYGMAVSIHGYAGQTTKVQFSDDGLSWHDIGGTEHTGAGTVFQQVIDPSSKHLRIEVDSPGAPLRVSIKRKR